MPVTVAIADACARASDIDEVFEYLRSVDRQFSPFREDSETERLARGEIDQAEDWLWQQQEEDKGGRLVAIIFAAVLLVAGIVGFGLL